MEVKAGYKQTEYGTIPEDWGLMELRSIAKYRRGSFPQPYGLSKWYDDISGNPFIQVVDVTDEMKLKPETKKRLSAEAEKMSVFAKKGSVIISLNGSVGRVALTHYDGFIDRTLLLFESFSVPLDKCYFIYALSAVFREEEKKAPGAILKTITKEHLSNFLLPLPKIAEQEAIGEALSDADALIEALEGLIAKKRQVKQGAMQELLRPKENWVEKRLGNTAVLKARIGWQGLTTKEYLDSGDYYLITGTEFKNGYIDWDDCHYVDMSRYKQDKNIQIREHDVLVTKDGTIGKIALITDLPKPATLNSGVFVIRPIDDAFYPEFFYYLLCSNVFIEFLNQLSAGSTINHLYQKDFVNFVYKTPPTLEEQTAIAEILSDMDAEIAALEGKLSKAREVKQGMMSVLLTGKIRLNHD